MKRSLNKRQKPPVHFAALRRGRRRERHARVAQTSAGKRFEATLTTPTAPTARKGSVKRIVAAQNRELLPAARATSSLTRSTLPLASLIATMFAAHRRASLTTVSAAISTRATARNVIEHDRQRASRARSPGNGGKVLPGSACCNKARRRSAPSTPISSRLSRVRDRVAGGIRTGAGDHLATARARSSPPARSPACVRRG